MSISRRTVLALPLAALAMPKPIETIDYDALAKHAAKLLEDVIIDPRNVITWADYIEQYVRKKEQPT